MSRPAVPLPSFLLGSTLLQKAYLRSVAEVQQGQGCQRAQPEQVKVRDAASGKPQRRQPRQVLPEDLRLRQWQQAKVTMPLKTCIAVPHEAPQTSIADLRLCSTTSASARVTVVCQQDTQRLASRKGLSPEGPGIRPAVLMGPHPCAVPDAIQAGLQLPGGLHVLVVSRRRPDVAQVEVNELSQSREAQRSAWPAQLVAAAQAAQRQKLPSAPVLQLKKADSKAQLTTNCQRSSICAKRTWIAAKQCLHVVK